MVLPFLLRPGRRLVIHTRIHIRPSSLISRPFTTRSTLWDSVRTLAELQASIKPTEPTEEEVEAAKEAISRLPQEAQDLLHRQFPLTHEFISPAQSHLLTLTLQPYLNFSDIVKPDPSDEKVPHNPFTIKAILPIYGTTLPPAFHFAYFNGYTQEEDLSPDGYISTQAPGGPWTRRMWAGGKLTYNRMPEKRQKGQDKGARRARPLDVGRRAFCHETVEDVQMKGEPGSPNEMMFVHLRRKLWATGYIVREPTKSPKIKEIDEFDDSKVILPDEEVPLIEQRVLVYMRQKPTEASEKAEQAENKGETPEVPSKKAMAKEMAPTSKISSRAEKAEFSHSFTPSRQLLFRYSALTFNAHKIHFDTEYTKNVEGHRDLLVHGPLTLTFLLELLRNHILGLEKTYRLASFDYRNIAPIYVDEKLHIYGRELPDAPVPIQEVDDYNPRDRLVPMYDEMDDIRKELQRRGMNMDPDMDPEENKKRKKELRRMLNVLKKESEKLEKFELKPKRIIEYRNYELWAENDKGQIVVRGTALIEDVPAKVELTPEQQWKRYQSEMARNKKLMQKQQLRAHKDMIRARRRARKVRLRSQQMERESVRRIERERIWKEAREAIARGELPEDHQPDFTALDLRIREMERMHKEELEAADNYLRQSIDENREELEDTAAWQTEIDEIFEQEDFDEDGEDKEDDEDPGSEDDEDEEYEYQEEDEGTERREEEYDDDDIEGRRK
ncbi:hypothetical protein TWF730_008593 [Orbilia blumenaviensis]|uniref:MaoC-like domain-containing protein n=1 Tax=Orbilia blumenaviensis TaxID=1796055 RepID=A0AAV9V9E6_9PEZI